MKRRSTCARFGHCLRFLIPFVILVIYICCAASIVLSVEKSYFNANSNSCSVHLPPACSWSITSDGMWRSIHFVITLITTIGYGDIFPCSPWGRAISIIICLIGVPLTLLCLTRLGLWLEDNLNKMWSFMKLCCCCCGRKSKNKGSVKPSSARSRDEEEEEEEDVPLTLGLIVTVIWIMICTIYFYFTLKSYYSQKQFTFLTALYFTLISLLTIGLGDIAPETYHLVFINFILIIIGLALATMCINIVQTKLENMFQNAIKAIQREYQNSVIEQQEGDNSLALDPKKAAENVTSILNKNPNAKWLTPFISDAQKDKLVGEWQNKAKMVSRSCQTVRKSRDATFNTDPVETEDFGCYTDTAILRSVSH